MKVTIDNVDMNSGLMKGLIEVFVEEQDRVMREKLNDALDSLKKDEKKTFLVGDVTFVLER